MTDELIVTDFRKSWNLPGPSVIVDGKYLFYVGFNCNMLVKNNLSANTIEGVYYIPIKKPVWRAFGALYQYEHYIFILPKWGKEIWIFDIQTEQFEEFKQDILQTYDDDKVRFRDSLQVGNYIWMVSSQKKSIIKIDAKKRTIKAIDLSNLACSNELGQPIEYNGYIYITSRNIDPGIKINLADEEIEVWNIGADVSYGAIFKDVLYFASSQKNIGGIYGRNIYTGKTEKCVPIDDDSDIERYRYWRTRMYGESVFFLPYDAYKMIKYDINENSMQYISPYSKYIEKWRNKAMVYDMLVCGDAYAIIPYMVNQITIMSKNFEIINTLEYPLDVRQLLEQESQNSYYYEKTGCSVKEMLEIIGKDNREKISDEYTIGEKIHNAMSMKAGV